MYFIDLDGTILDSNEVWQDIDVEFLARYGISPPPEDYTDFVTHHAFVDSAHFTKERFRLTESPEEIIAIWEAMAAEAYAHRLPLKPGAREFLQRVQRSGTPCALLTSCIPALALSALENHGIAHFFDPILTTTDLGLDKRDPALYRKLAQQLGLAPEQCILFDDSPYYCAAAEQAGWRVCGLPDPAIPDQGGMMAELCPKGVYPFSFDDPLP